MNPNNEITFNTLFKKYKESFTLFAKSYVRNEMAAEDIYMDSMLKFWEKRDSLPEDTNIPAYILTIVKNKSLNYLRHQAIEYKTLNNLSDTAYRELSLNIYSLESCEPVDLFVEDIHKIISSTLNELSENTKKVFYLSRFSHFSNKDIAAKLNISEKGVEYHMARALKVLKVALKDYLMIIVLFLLH